eukprot:TRINITY_DN2740_c0_g1_i1.p1 TRINITY_DN2740_c0_g1~~TRINITY_DN2740_c0_g1_i1.p1  ORF type:complete len:152 (+),score=40.58 TRINITY_DN2740_c0_g1_i1:31-456(+)
MTLTLYVDFMSQPSRAIVWFCLLNKIEHKVQVVQIAKGEQRSAEFAKINPNKQLPAIKDGDFALFESHAILRYLCATRQVADHWYPRQAQARALVDQYLDWHHSNIRRGAAGLTFVRFLAPRFGLPVYEGQEKEVLRILNA